MKTDSDILHSDDLPDMDDDALLTRTTDDVLAVLGFDPLDFASDAELASAVESCGGQLKT